MCFSGKGSAGRPGGTLFCIASRRLQIIVFFFRRVLEDGSGYSITTCVAVWALLVSVIIFVLSFGVNLVVFSVLKCRMGVVKYETLHENVVVSVAHLLPFVLLASDAWL